MSKVQNNLPHLITQLFPQTPRLGCSFKVRLDAQGRGLSASRVLSADEDYLEKP